MPADYVDQAERDAHDELHHEWAEEEAVRDAWRLSPLPYDFTGASYLDEYANPLREKTALMERFTRRVDCSRETDVEFEEFALEPDRDNLRIMLDIDEVIFDDGDGFLQDDPGLLDDSRKIEVIALGAVLAETSMRHGAFQFWPRLRAMGPTAQMVREARGWWLLANIDLEPEHDFYSSRLEDVIAEFHPDIEKIVAAGGLAVEGLHPDKGGWEAFSVTHDLPRATLRDLLSAYLRRDAAAVERIYDRAASEAEAQARKAKRGLFLRGRVQRIEGSRVPGTHCDTSFLRFASEWGEVAARDLSPKASALARKGIARAVKNRGRSRSRCSRGHTRRRTAGSRRSSSSDDGGGGGSDPPSLADLCGNHIARRLLAGAKIVRTSRAR